MGVAVQYLPTLFVKSNDKPNFYSTKVYQGETNEFIRVTYRAWVSGHKEKSGWPWTTLEGFTQDRWCPPRSLGGPEPHRRVSPRTDDATLEVWVALNHTGRFHPGQMMPPTSSWMDAASFPPSSQPVYSSCSLIPCAIRTELHTMGQGSGLVLRWGSLDCPCLLLS